MTELKVIDKGYKPQQTSMFLNVDAGAYGPNIASVRRRGQVWLEPAVNPEYRNVMLDGGNIGTASIAGDRALDLGSGWSAHHLPLQVLRNVVRALDAEIDRVDASPVEIWSADGIDNTARVTPFELPTPKKQKVAVV